MNINAVRGVFNAVKDILTVPLTFEEILRDLFTRFGMTMTPQQYVLIGSTLRSYLSALYTKGVITFACAGGRMLWSIAVPQGR